MVTFNKTDPPFAFDLSDPEDPQVLGEAKTPGFSTYIHMLDDKHLAMRPRALRPSATRPYPRVSPVPRWVNTFRAASWRARSNS